jgi:hypothetical protein
MRRKRILRSFSMKTPKLTRRAVAALAVTFLAAAWAVADAPPGPYFNGFETNTAGWFNYSGATVTRVASGDVSATYASGVSAATGSDYARLGIDPSPSSCIFGGGTAPIFYGPYTNWGGYSAIFPPGGYSTGVDIYLDVPYAQSHPDTRFDWSSAINDASGNFRRDFVFNVGTDALGFVMTGGNNSTRCGANPADPGHAPVVHITQSGWYTFKHTFSGVSGGPLAVTLEVVQKSTGAVLGTWVRSDPTDIIGTTVGGNRYGWFVQNEFDGLAIDNSFRTGVMSTPNCTIKITNGGWFTADNSDVATFGGNAMVSAGGSPSGQEVYQDHGPTQPLAVQALSVAAIVCGSDRTTATIIGTASVNGSGSYEYEIDVKDGGEPGTNDTYAIRIPGVAYSSGEHNLQGGNIEIH